MLDRREELALLPMHDEEAVPLLESLPADERFASWHLALDDGSLAGYGTGGVELLGAMRLTRPAVRVLRHVPDRALDVLYRSIAGHRNVLGSLVPDGPAPRRYP